VRISCEVCQRAARTTSPVSREVFSTAHRLLRAMRGFFCLLSNCYKELLGDMTLG